MKFPRLTPAELERRVKEADQDPFKILALCPLAEPEAAKELRRRGRELLQEKAADATAADLQKLLEELARLLPQVARTPTEVEEILGPRRKVVRQILFRRYLEQWLYDPPLALGVTFSANRGEELRLLSARPLPRTSP